MDVIRVGLLIPFTKRWNMQKPAIITMWSSTSVLTLACVLFLVWQSSATHQRDISDANASLKIAISDAQEWLKN
jgi:hypothetical protein